MEFLSDSECQPVAVNELLFQDMAGICKWQQDVENTSRGLPGRPSPASQRKSRQDFPKYRMACGKIVAIPLLWY
jgi:hypothetical protein